MWRRDSRKNHMPTISIVIHCCRQIHILDALAHPSKRKADNTSSVSCVCMCHWLHDIVIFWQHYERDDFSPSGRCGEDTTRNETLLLRYTSRRKRQKESTNSPSASFKMCDAHMNQRKIPFTQSIEHRRARNKFGRTNWFFSLRLFFHFLFLFPHRRNRQVALVCVCVSTYMCVRFKWMNVRWCMEGARASVTHRSSDFYSFLFCFLLLFRLPLRIFRFSVLRNAKKDGVSIWDPPPIIRVAPPPPPFVLLLWPVIALQHFNVRPKCKRLSKWFVSVRKHIGLLFIPSVRRFAIYSFFFRRRCHSIVITHRWVGIDLTRAWPKRIDFVSFVET